MQINNENYELKYSLRSMFVFEEITGKAFEVKTMFDEYILIYSCLVSVKTNPTLDFDEFIDWCSEHPEVLEEFTEYMKTETKRRESLGKKKVMESQMVVEKN